MWRLARDDKKLVYELNKKVFSERLKQSRDTGRLASDDDKKNLDIDECRSSDDRVLQASSPNVENDRGPM